MRFHLTKWYADCCSPGGEVFIAYSATLRWYGIRVSYSGTVDGTGRTSGRFRLGSREALSARGERDHVFEQKGFGKRRWTTLIEASPLPSLLSLPEGEVVWSPRALKASVFEDAESSFLGTGYVERLRLTLEPWKTGLRRLHWGRWIGERHAMTWVKWEGLHPLGAALFDGKPEGLATANSTGVELRNGAVLTFGESRLFVESVLGEDALRLLSSVPGLIRRPFLRGVERKYVAAAVLMFDDGFDEGWTIHEDVTWNT